MRVLTKSEGCKLLHDAEAKIRKGMEEYYYSGRELKPIRDDELYKFDGFETWEKYCREQWEWSAERARRLITASEYREKLPSPTNVGAKWSEGSVRELTRIPDKRQAARVAGKIIKEIEKSHEEAAKDPDRKPLKLSSSTVRKFVDEDLGIDRAAKAKATKAIDRRPKLRDWIDEQTGAIRGILAALQQAPEDAWTLLNDDEPQLMKRFITAIESLAAFLRKVER